MRFSGGGDASQPGEGGNMKRKKQWGSESAVLKEIDRLRDEATRLNMLAESSKRQAEDCGRRAMELDERAPALKGKARDEAEKAANNERANFEKLMAEARGARKRAKTIEEATLANLGEALSELKTMPLGGGIWEISNIQAPTSSE
jgi:hypothetical protein